LEVEARADVEIVEIDTRTGPLEGVVVFPEGLSVVLAVVHT
jgi:hypothetical protein